MQAYAVHGRPPLLRLQQASVRFGEVQALQQVSLDIHPGEVIALVGANGSGKTTLLRTLHGVVNHTGLRELGVVSAPGEAVPRPAVQCMVYQRPFMLKLSVRNNLRLALWLGGVPRGQWAARTDEALQRVGLAGFGGRPARALSGGQQQRLALARAWVVRPDVLFLDEPTASLDPGAKKEIEALMADFASDGTALVMSTHNLGQAKRLATRVVYLEAGRLVVDLPKPVFFFGGAQPGMDKVDTFLKGELAWNLE